VTGRVTGSVGRVTGNVGSVHGSVGDGGEAGAAVAANVLPGPASKVLSREVSDPHVVKSGIVKLPANVESDPALATPWRIMVIGAVVHELPTMLMGGSVLGTVGSVTGTVASVTGTVGSEMGMVGSVMGMVGSVPGTPGRPDDEPVAWLVVEVDAVTIWRTKVAVAVTWELERFM